VRAGAAEARHSPNCPCKSKGMNVSTPAFWAPDHVRRTPPGEELTRRAITVVTAAIVAMALAFSVVNVTRSLNF
jgi:hypothetical protein